MWCAWAVAQVPGNRRDTGKRKNPDKSGFFHFNRQGLTG
jgi:hypothetical protein